MRQLGTEPFILLIGLSFRCKGVTETTSSYEKCLEEINCMWWIRPTKNGPKLADKRKMYVYDSQSRFKTFLFFLLKVMEKRSCASRNIHVTRKERNLRDKNGRLVRVAGSLKASQILLLSADCWTTLTYNENISNKKRDFWLHVKWKWVQRYRIRQKIFILQPIYSEVVPLPKVWLFSSSLCNSDGNEQTI